MAVGNEALMSGYGVDLSTAVGAAKWHRGRQMIRTATAAANARIAGA